MRQAPERELAPLSEKPSNIFKLVKFTKKAWKDIEGERCVRGKDGKIGFGEQVRRKIWKNHMKEEVMNKEHDWDHMTEADLIEGPSKEITWEEMAVAIKH